MSNGNIHQHKCGCKWAHLKYFLLWERKTCSTDRNWIESVRAKTSGNFSGNVYHFCRLSYHLWQPPVEPNKNYSAVHCHRQVEHLQHSFDHDICSNTNSRLMWVTSFCRLMDRCMDCNLLCLAGSITVSSFKINWYPIHPLRTFTMEVPLFSDQAPQHRHQLYDLSRFFTWSLSRFSWQLQNSRMGQWT